MNPSNPNDAPREIRARIHNDALQRVTRFFTASIHDIFPELLQNARRAGATRVDVHIAPRTTTTATVTVRDDGHGIADPAVLLSFGENGWDEQLVQREDASGMGFLSLARQHSTIVSRPRTSAPTPAAGWRVDLAPEHFLGQTPATVHLDPEAPLPHGTSITFELDIPPSTNVIPRALDKAACHYPLPVTLTNSATTPAQHYDVERDAFLEDAIHVEPWQGLMLGVFTDRHYLGNLRDPDLNFHGLTLSINLPKICNANRTIWSVVADVVDCPELELVLPSRKEAVQTPFLDTLRAAARLAIYRAMARHPDPRPAFKDWTRAREAGIHIAPPPAELRPWRPCIAYDNYHLAEPDFTPLPNDALLVNSVLDPPASATLWRAARKTGIDTRLYAFHPALEGFDWFEALDQIRDIETRITLDKKTYILEKYPISERPPPLSARLPERPDTIFLVLGVRSHDGTEQPIILGTDLCLAGKDGSWIHDTPPIVTVDSRLQPHELAELLAETFYAPSDECHDADSLEQQRQSFDQDALHLATTLLRCEDDAARTTIADIVSRDLLYLIPPRPRRRHLRAQPHDHRHLQ